MDLDPRMNPYLDPVGASLLAIGSDYRGQAPCHMPAPTVGEFAP